MVDHACAALGYVAEAAATSPALVEVMTGGSLVSQALQLVSHTGVQVNPRTTAASSIMTVQMSCQLYILEAAFGQAQRVGEAAITEFKISVVFLTFPLDRLQVDL